MYLDDPATEDFFKAARDKLSEGQTISEHFPQPQPYQAGHHHYRPLGGAILCENHVVLLHSDAVEPGDNVVEKGRVLKTVRRNFEGWAKREVKEAKLARTLQSRVGNMCNVKLKQMASVNGLKNAPICPEHPEHVTNATHIFGPNTAALKGKTARRPSPRVHEDGG